MQAIITLGFLFQPKDMFAISPSSREFDNIQLSLMVSPDLKSPGVWSGILNLCARLCFETISFDPPLIVPKNSLEKKRSSLLVDLHGLDDNEPESVSIEKSNSHEVCIQSASAQALGMILNCLAMGSLDRPTPADVKPGESGTLTLSPGDRLTGIFKPQGILSDCQINGSALEDICLKTRGNKSQTKEISQPPLFHFLYFTGLFQKDPVLMARQKLAATWSLQSPILSFHAALALFDMISAMVMEATAITLPLVVDASDSAQMGKVTRTRPNSLCFRVDETDSKGKNKGDSLTIRFPDSSGPVSIKGNAQGFSDHLSPWVDLALNQGGPGFSRAQAVREQALGSPAIDLKETRPLHGNPIPIVHEFALESETHEILETLSHLKTGREAILCEVWLSKPQDIRTRLRDKIKEILVSKGFHPQVWVLNAFKPGLCRILELDLPALLEKKPARIHITYHPFDQINHALELKHRWLHELFPVAEILAEKLAIPEQSITLSMDADQEEIYELTAFDDKGGILFQDGFSPFFHTFDYMASHPELGTVSPTCSGITLKGEDQVLLKRTLPTDRDRFWKQFQTVCLPDLIKFMESRVQQGSLDRVQAFFDSIQVDVCMDESNFCLGFMDEQISPMEKLHEDIYFFLLKVFEQFSITHKLPDSLKLGQILPRVYSTAGTPGPWARIRALPAREIPLLPGHLGTRVMAFDTLVMNPTGWTLSGSLAEKEISLRLNLPPAGSDLAGFKEIPGPVPVDHLLTAAMVGSHLSRLNKMDHIQVWEISKSLQGRPIYGVEAFKVQGRYVSIPRLRIERPTILFNARHHANEISSTNAVLGFIEFLGSVQGQSILETANAVFIPLENVDGVATFEALYVKNSGDILHAARYNALGSEFYDQYFKYPPAFSEALAKQRLWHRWLPELVADLHGVPGHEWCQPFAGYLPAGFREFWIPRAFVYVHLPFLEDPAHPMYSQAMALAETMRSAMARAKKIVAANQRITALYQKYARIPEPDVFPEADNTDLTALPLLGRARNHNFAVHYPDITRAEVIVEVPDEVVHGETLALCVAAHYKIQESLIQALTPRHARVVESMDHEFDCMEFELTPRPRGRDR